MCYPPEHATLPRRLTAEWEVYNFASPTFSSLKPRVASCAGATKASQKWRPLPIAPSLMSSITKASGSVKGLASERRISAELPDQAQSSLLPTEANVGSATGEETPNPAEHGLKRRRDPEETPRPIKLRPAGVRLH